MKEHKAELMQALMVTLLYEVEELKRAATQQAENRDLIAEDHADLFEKLAAAEARAAAAEAARDGALETLARLADEHKREVAARSPTRSMPVREWAKARGWLTGEDAQGLEHALMLVERERDALVAKMAAAEIRLKGGGAGTLAGATKET